MGKAALYYDDDVHAAARHGLRAVALEPGNAEALRFHSIVLKTLGRPEEAVQAARAATEADPTLPSLWNALGDALLAAGRNAEAVDALRRAISLQAGYGPALERLELAFMRLGQLEDALEIRLARLRTAGRGDRAERLATDVTDRGPGMAIEEDVRRELGELLERADREDPFDNAVMRTLADRIILVCAQLGEWPSAMDWVERSYHARPGRLRRVLADLPFDRRGLAIDPRYARLLRVAGLEDLL
jgi:tetratricopeptide (TPR) repeat protein